MEMGEPLEQIIAGTYDHEGAREKATRDRRLRAKHEVAIRSIHDKISVGEFEAAIVQLDELIAIDGEVFADLTETKINLLTHQVGDLDRTYTYVRELQTNVYKNNRWMLHALAQMILSTEPFSEDRDVVLALRLAERANELSSGEDPSVLETIALAESMLRTAEQHGTAQSRPAKPGDAHGGSGRATPNAAAPASPAIDPKSVWDAGVRLGEQIDEHGYRAIVLESQVAQDGTETPLFLYLVEVSADHGVFRGYRTYKHRSEPEGPPRIDPETFERQAHVWSGRLDEFPQTTAQRLTESGWLLESVNGQRIQTRGSEVSTPEPSFTVASLAFRPSLRAPSRWIASPQIETVASDESDGAAFRIRGRLPSENATALPNIKQRVAELHFDADPPLLRCFRITGDPTGEYEVWELERRIVETQAFPGLGVPVPAVLETFERFGEKAHILSERRKIRVVFLP